MRLFGGPNVSRLAEQGDLEGLIHCLEDSDPLVCLEAAEALVTLGEWRGLVYLISALKAKDPTVRAAAAEILGESGDQRALPGLQATFHDLDQDVRHAVHEALEKIGGAAAVHPAPKGVDIHILRKYFRQAPKSPDIRTSPEYLGASQAPASLAGRLQEAGLEDGEPSAGLPVPGVPGAGDTVFGEPDRPIHPPPTLPRFLTPEEHFQRADQFLEQKHRIPDYDVEHALVECNLVLDSLPAWADAHNLRGIILEEMNRPVEAQEAYLQAYALDPTFSEAQENAADLEAEVGPGPADDQYLVSDLFHEEWSLRQAAAVRIGQRQVSGAYADLVDALKEEDQPEVRSAMVVALGRLRAWQAAGPLYAVYCRWADNLTYARGSGSDLTRQYRWRASLIRHWCLGLEVLTALSQIGDINLMVRLLKKIIVDAQRQNLLLIQIGQPDLNEETVLILEAGLHALERSGDIGGLLAVLPASTSGDQPASPAEPTLVGQPATGPGENPESGADSEAESDTDESGELDFAVDEVTLLVANALENLVRRQTASLPEYLLRRLAALPDPLLPDPGWKLPEKLYDFGSVRNLARAALAGRGIYL